MTRIAIVDYGLGNLFSVERAFSAQGASASITSDPAALAAAEGVVLPGVGAFGEGMQNLEQLGLAGEVRRLAMAGKPTLGICLGMQLLMDESEELGSWRGLGLIPGRVVRFTRSTDRPEKVPQIGWNTIDPPNAHGSSTWTGTLLDGILPGEFVYFVHSYCVLADVPSDLLAETEYGGTRFCSVAVRANVMGCQFHPEKSGDAGLRLIRNFLASIQPIRDGAP
jgi:glutamine amidotransferase